MIIERNFIKLETQKGIYTNIFKSINISKTLDSFAGEFSFTTAVDSIKKELEINVNDQCKIYINDKLVMTGFIDKKSKNITQNERLLSFSGFEKTSDLIMSTLEENVYNTPISLENIIKKTCEDCGFKVVNSNYKQMLGDNTIKIISNVKTDYFVEENIQRTFGESAFSFFSKYANKRQVILITDPEGNIIITRRGKTNVKTAINITKDNIEHNAEEIAYNEDISSRFNKYIIKSQLAGDKSGYSAINDQVSYQFDNDIRKTKINAHTSDVTQNITSAKNTSKWKANIEKARGFTYSIIVYGFSLDEEKNILWDLNQVVKIADDETLTYGDFLIKSLNYTQTDKSTTRLDLTFKDGYELF